MGSRKRRKGFTTGLRYAQRWEYQSCEDPTWRDDAVYQMREQIQYAILHLLESKFCGEDTVWTTWKDPKLDSHIVNISDMFARY